jgi:Putative ABC exporter
MGRALRSPKGIVLTLVGLCVFVPQFLAMTVFQDESRALRLGWTRTLGPWLLLALTILTLVTTGSERGIHFTPAEVGFLFPAPFSRRRLLLYKVFGAVGLTFLTCIFMVIAFGSNAAHYWAAYLGLVLIFSYLTLLTMAISMLGAAVGEAARTWRRRLVLVVVLTLIATSISTSLNQFMELRPAEAFRRLNASPVTQGLLTPFRWYIGAFTAEWLWPDFLRYASLAFAVNLGLLVAIVGLDAQYLEMAAANSERLYAKIERMRRGGIGGTIAPTLASRGGPRKELPMLPRWGGAGGIAWRQLTTAWRDWARSLVLLLTSVGIAGLGVFALTRSDSSGDPAGAIAFGSIILVTSVFLTVLTTFDFRGDVDRIETLKALPVSANRVVLGQLLAPILINTVVQAVSLLVLGIGAGVSDPLYWGALLFLPAFNMILFEVENLMFLWFPVRMNAVAPGDLTVLGRTMLVLFAKFWVFALALGFAGVAGAAGYFLVGWGLAYGASWIVLWLVGIALVPLLSSAFVRFDVARDTPA